MGECIVKVLDFLVDSCAKIRESNRLVYMSDIFITISDNNEGGKI